MHVLHRHLTVWSSRSKFTHSQYLLRMDWDFSNIDLTNLPAYGGEDFLELSERNNGIEVVQRGRYSS